jgi:hypothetical protein
MRSVRGTMPLWPLLLALLSSCGGGGGGSGGGNTAPSDLSYKQPPALIVGSAMTSLTPTVSGSPSSYAVSPALPAGLSISSTSGVISGTPTQATAFNGYVVAATNAAGSTQTTVPISVISSLYVSSFYSFTAGVTAQTIQPRASAGAGNAFSWSISPALPAGLALNTGTGEITGTPTTATTAAPFVVTSSAPGGASTQSLTLAVTAAPLLDLGHVTQVIYERFVGSSLLTQDGLGHWNLQSYTDGTSLASGTTALNESPGDAGNLPSVDLKGSTVVIQSTAGLEIRSASSGSIAAEIATTPTWWALASDGSYVCAGSGTALTVWSPSGTQLFTVSGNYSNALVYAAPTQVQVALGAKGASLIETITVPAGTSSTAAPFSGTFQSWFTDGSHFTTATGTTAWVYSTASVQQEIATLSTTAGLGGYGNWYWTGAQQNNVYLNVSNCCNAPFTVYAIGSGGTVSGSYTPGMFGPPGPIPSGSTVAVFTGTPTAPQVTVVDLSGASLVASTHAVPTNMGQLSGYAASTSGTFVLGSDNGTLLDGATLGGALRYLDYGAVTSIAGSPTTVALATASGRILYYAAATNTLLGTIDQFAQSIQLSSAGSVLAASGAGSYGNASSQPITVYALPAGTLTATFPLGNTELQSMTLSGSGTVIGEVIATAGACTAQTINVSSGTTSWCATTPPAATLAAVQLSPDGSSAAPAQSLIQEGLTLSTNLYSHGTLTTAVPGIVEAWIDNSTVLVSSCTFGIDADEEYTYNGAAIYNLSGQLQSSPPLPATGPVQVLTSSTVYSPLNNGIYSLTSGGQIWSSGSPNSYDLGAAAAMEVVFVAGNLVLAEPYPGS